MRKLCVLVLGGTGMLGNAAFNALIRRFTTFRTVRGEWDSFYTVPFVDVLSTESVRYAVAQIRPNVVINCIGIVKQSSALQDRRIAIVVNALFPHQLADICRSHDARLIHVSTDCVFSGRKGNYNEGDIPDPVDLYGRTKLLGEVIDRPRCLTVRTSFIGRQAGLLRWFLDQEGRTVNGYTDAIYSGFTVDTLVRILGDLIADFPDLSGLYHVSSEPISKHDLLIRVRDALNLNVAIEPWVNVKCNRSLDSTRFWSETGLTRPSWGEMIAELARCD